MSDEDATRRLRRSVSVDLGLLEENYRAVTRLVAPGVALLCVIKDDAYGHGAVEAGRRLEAAGAAYFGVANIDEGKELREAGIATPILVLSGLMPWEPLEPLAEYGLTPAVTNFEMLERFAAWRGNSLKIHVKIDTGMGRLGFPANEVGPLAERLATLSNIEVEGVMSHFASSERRDEYGLGQLALFRQGLERLWERGIAPRFVHMANSSAICVYPEAHFTMVRPGIMLYGSYPDAAVRKKVKLTPVMTWKSHISFVRTFQSGSNLSYGRTYITEGETRVAYVPVGYAHGYPRSLSNRGTVLVGGKRCAVIGRVCMDWIFVDVTDVGSAKPGDEVVVLGCAQGDCITADEIAAKIGTIPYEILCGVSKRIARHHVR
jgi:alanine racemase